MPKKASSSKQKGSARSNAAAKIGARERSGGPVKTGVSEKQRSQGRLPGETPLTGEDRPADRSGGKKG